jgi:hypothetical protein
MDYPFFIQQALLHFSLGFAQSEARGKRKLRLADIRKHSLRDVESRAKAGLLGHLRS